jgi:hypothetical protein
MVAPLIDFVLFIVILLPPQSFIISSPTIQAIWASKSPFVPRNPEIVTIGRTSVALYPQVNKNMTDPKKALAYQHNKTALASADLDQRARILTLADRLNLMLTAKSSLADGNENSLAIGQTSSTLQSSLGTTRRGQLSP